MAKYKEVISEMPLTDFYGANNGFNLIFFDNDNIPELVIGDSYEHVKIYTYDFKNEEIKLLSEHRTGVRGATEINYIEREGLVIVASAGMLFDSELADYEGAIGGHSRWGHIEGIDEEEYREFSFTYVVMDENDSSKNISINNCDELTQSYLDRAKEFELKTDISQFESIEI